jgi:hypothetical protein
MRTLCGGSQCVGHCSSLVRCRWCRCTVCLAANPERGRPYSERTVQLHRAADVQRATAAVASAAAATAVAAAALSNDLMQEEKERRAMKRQRVESDSDDDMSFGGGGGTFDIASPTRTPPRSPNAQDSTGEHPALCTRMLPHDS